MRTTRTLITRVYTSTTVTLGARGATMFPLVIYTRTRVFTLFKKIAGMCTVLLPKVTSYM